MCSSTEWVPVTFAHIRELPGGSDPSPAPNTAGGGSEMTSLCHGGMKRKHGWKESMRGLEQEGKNVGNVGVFSRTREVRLFLHCSL